MSSITLQLEIKDKEIMPKVYIGSKNMRGKWAPKPKGGIIVDVTSAQRKASSYRIDFSPMTEIKGSYKGFYSFENYWQSGKVFENIDHKTTLEWWKKLKASKRRYPKSKGLKVLHATFGDKKKLDYIASRKDIYVPEYYSLIENTRSLKTLRGLRASGKDIAIYDFDGPRKPDGEIDILEVTPELLKDKINDPKFPFGHGYVVAAALLDLRPVDYASHN